MPAISLPSIGEQRKEAGLRAVAFTWGVIIGIGGYVIIAILAVIAAVDVAYQFLTNRNGIGAAKHLYTWMAALSYWESDNYAYAFAEHEEPAWLPDTGRGR